jgi:hypothetical protein
MARGALLSSLLAVASCVVDAEVPQVPPPAPPDAPPQQQGQFGLVVEPRLGAVVPGDPGGATITVAGVHENPGYAISVQILAKPDDANSWIEVGTATTDTTASATDASMYEWRTTIAPAALDPTRWPAGGLLRVRAVGAGSEVLGAFFHDSDDCFKIVPLWRDRAPRCGAPLATGIVIANTAVSPLDLAARPRFLDQRGTVDVTETAAYYQAIAAPTTLSAFRTAFGFVGDEATSVYYNGGDLGIGRGMHCKATTTGGLACYVSNYGTFGGDYADAITRAANGEAAGGTGAFASVAMVYTPPAGAPNSVQFMVYGAAGGLISSATLDRFGDNTSIPNNCLNCHGAGATYDSTTHASTGAHFLPFDPGVFRYSSEPGLTASDQAQNVARLNQMVAAADVTPAIVGITANPAQIPDGWGATPFDKAVYRNVTAYACRGCHSTLEGGLQFANAGDFRASGSTIGAAVCASDHRMPSAEVPFERVWNGPARAYLAAYLNLTGACAP